MLSKDFSIFVKKNQNGLQNLLIQLRKCSNHPYLFNGIEPEPFVQGEHLVQASGKLMALDKILLFLHKNNRKVLVI